MRSMFALYALVVVVGVILDAAVGVHGG